MLEEVQGLVVQPIERDADELPARLRVAVRLSKGGWRGWSERWSTARRTRPGRALGFQLDGKLIRLLARAGPMTKGNVRT